MGLFFASLFGYLVSVYCLTELNKEFDETEVRRIQWLNEIEDEKIRTEWKGR